ncbi:hypothetical protein MMC13_006494 [Lambiella insularis]|nr:hypothetical protein [Lambiella insularis]
MGGYSLDVSMDPQPRIWPEKVDRLTLSPKGVLACLGSQDNELRELPPFLSKDEIWDKSKANNLAKAIVCIQAVWFCAQVVRGLVPGMSISLLELNTFAHALCALLVYLLWWSKPLIFWSRRSSILVNRMQRGTYAYWAGPVFKARLLIFDLPIRPDREFGRVFSRKFGER